MDIGIGLPNTLAIDGPAVVRWARRAEERGFHSLATIDRIVYPSYDSLTALAVAAGATSRIRLFTDILLTPAYQPVWLAKATASLDAMSGGRLTLGLGVGGRPDDFVAMQRPFERRGQLMDETLALLRRAFAGALVTDGEFPVNPPPASGNRVSILVGGTSDAAVRRTVEYADGWTAGGGGVDLVAQMIDRVCRAWQGAGRAGEPRFAALVYYGLGDEAASRASLRTYYGFLGQWTQAVVDNAARSPSAVRDVAARFAEAGVHELIFSPTIADVAEVDRLADAVLYQPPVR